MMKMDMLMAVLLVVTLQGVLSDPKVSTSKEKLPDDIHVLPVDVHQLLVSDLMHGVEHNEHFNHVADKNAISHTVKGKGKPTIIIHKPNRKPRKEKKMPKAGLRSTGKQLLKHERKFNNIVQKPLNKKVPKVIQAKGKQKMISVKKQSPTSKLNKVVLKGRKGFPNRRKGQARVGLRKRPRNLVSRRIKGQRRRGKLFNKIKSIIGSLQRKGKRARKMPTGYLRRLVGIPSRRFRGKNDVKKIKLNEVLKQAGVGPSYAKTGKPKGSMRQGQSNKAVLKGQKGTSKVEKGRSKVALQKRPRNLVSPPRFKGQKRRGKLFNKIKSIIGSLQRKGKRTRKMPTGYLRRLVGIPSRRFRGKNDVKKLKLNEVFQKAGVIMKPIADKGPLSDADVSRPKKKFPGDKHEVQGVIHQTSKPDDDVEQGKHFNHVTDLHVTSHTGTGKSKPIKTSYTARRKPRKENGKQRTGLASTGKQLMKRGRNLTNIVKNTLKSRKRNEPGTKRKQRRNPTKPAKSRITNRPSKFQKAGLKDKKESSKGKKGQAKGPKKQMRRLALSRRGKMINNIKSIIGSLQRKGQRKTKMPSGYLRRLVGIPSRRFKGNKDLNKLKLDDVLRQAGVKLSSTIKDNDIISKAKGIVEGKGSIRKGGLIKNKLTANKD